MRNGPQLKVMGKAEVESVAESELMSFPNIEVVNQIRSGHPVADADFDRIFPEEIRSLSKIHWTPISVARRAAELAVRKPGDLVLDVGSGVGKFCIIGALTTAGKFHGVEQREYLVDSGRKVVARFGLSKVQLIHKNMVDLDWLPFDAIYLFNPFFENIEKSIRIDDQCALSSDLFVTYVRQTQSKLDDLNVGVRIVTFNGFGGDFPPSYRLIHEEKHRFISLQVWEKY